MTTTPTSANASGTGSCPRCGQADPGPVACLRCGVIFAKIRARSTPAPATIYPPLEDRPSAFSWGNVLALVVVIGCGVVGWRGLRAPARSSPAAAPAESRASHLPADGAVPPPPTLAPVPVSAPESIRVEAAGMSDEDRRQADALVHRLPASGAADVTAAEQLYARHPAEVRNLLEATLLSAAASARQKRHFPEAVAHLRRAEEVQTEAARPCLLLMGALMEAGDWAGAEAAARAALAREPRHADGWQGLGYALIRQDRNTEASEALRSALEIRPDPSAQALLDRVSKGMADERGMTEQHLSHFHVRYDGEAHDDVGREILRALERHHATLVSALDHQPQVTIPVVLFSRESYYDKTGAPAWAGGHYDQLDGRIRVPIQGLTRSLTPDMDYVLLHELTHAFVADRTRGVAPRDVNEGLAQYLGGKRVTTMLTPEQLTVLADGRVGGVPGLYLYGLAFVEYLVANRGMGGINELLRAMGETGSVDEAFRRVHGQDYRATKKAWFQRLHQQHGS